MVVAPPAKMVLLSGSLLDSWRQVVSPFWKWRLMTTAAPTLVIFGAIGVDFIIWSLCFTILIEISLCIFSGDHTFTYSFNEVVSLWIIVVRSWWEVGCPQGGRSIRHCSMQRSWLPLLLRPIGGAGGRVMPPLPFGLGAYKSLVVRSNSCRAWCAGLSMQARVFTKWCMDSFNRRSSKGALLASVYRLDTGLVQNAPNASHNIKIWMLSSCRTCDLCPRGACVGKSVTFICLPLRYSIFFFKFTQVITGRVQYNTIRSGHHIVDGL